VPVYVPTAVTSLSCDVLILSHRVAIFDVVRSPNKEEPFVLLQPRPRLEDGLTNMNKLPNFASAYVGLVQETGSLFAMSAEQFPLVAFTDSNENVPALSSDNGAVGDGTRKTCRNGASDRECLTGNRQLEESSWPWRNLLDGVPSVAPPPNAGAGIGMGMSEPNRFQQLVDNASIVPPSWTWAGDRRPLSTLLSLEEQPHGMSILASILFTMCVSAMWLYRKIKPGRFPVNVADKGDIKNAQGADDGMKRAEITPAETVDSNGAAQHTLVNKPQDVTPPASKAVPFLTLPPPPPQSALLISDDYVFLEGDNSGSDNNIKSKDAGPGTVQPSEDLMEGDDSEREGEGTPGKRKGPKKKRRGKKKKASVVNGGLEDEDGDKEKDNAQDVQGQRMASPSGLVISPTPKAEPVGSSLIVSDTILGR
jgi:serine/threonine-protein kinase/endoribonuclease IRE1